MSRLGVPKLWASLGHTGRKRVVLDHMLNTLQHVIIKKSHNVLRKFTILCWATFTAILRYVRPVGHRLDTPGLDLLVHDFGGKKVSDPFINATLSSSLRYSVEVYKIIRDGVK